MFTIYIKNYRSGGQIISAETPIMTIPLQDRNHMVINSPTVNCDWSSVPTFDFEVEQESPYYDSFLHMRTIMRVDYDGTTIFRGRVLTISNTLWGNRKIKCEDGFGYLADVPAPGVEDKNRQITSLHDYLTDLIGYFNSLANDPDKVFALGQVPGQYTTADATQQVPEANERHGNSSWTDVKSLLDGLASDFGGYWQPVYDPSTGVTTLNWLANYFQPVSVSNQAVEIRKNLIDLSNSFEVDNIFTAVIPIGQGDENKAVNIVGYNTQYHDGNYIKVSDLAPVADGGRGICTAAELNRGYHTVADYAQSVNNYGMIFRVVDFGNADTPALLWTYAIDWIKNNYQGVVRDFSIKAVDLHQIGTDGNSIQKYLVGDQVRVIYPQQADNAGDLMTIKSISYDLFNPENTSLTIGYPSDLLDHEYGEKKNKTTKKTSKKSSPSVGGSGSKKNDSTDVHTVDLHKSIRQNFIDPGYNQKYGTESYASYTEVTPTPLQRAIQDGTRKFSEGVRYISDAYHISEFRDKNGTQRGIALCRDGIFVYSLDGDYVERWINAAENGIVTINDVSWKLNTAEGKSSFIADLQKGEFTVAGTKGNVEIGKDSATGNAKVGVYGNVTVIGAEKDEEGRSVGGVKVDGTNETVEAGYDRTTGDWTIKLNDTYTYTDPDTHEEKTITGMIKVNDIKLPEIPSFKTDFIKTKGIAADNANFITAHADKISAVEAWFDKLTAQSISAETFVRAGSIYVHSAFVAADPNATPIVLRDLALCAWGANPTHAVPQGMFSFSESNGSISLTIQKLNGTSETHSFDMAATQFYADAIAAAEDRGRESVSVTITSDNIGDINYDSIGKVYAGNDSASIYLTKGSWKSNGTCAINARLGSINGNRISRIWISKND